MAIKAAPVIRMGYIMMFLNMIVAMYFWLHGNDEDDRFHTALFMGGAMLWILVILVWYKVQGTEEK